MSTRIRGFFAGIALLAALAAAPAQAVPITFDFADGMGNRSVGPQLISTVDGLTVTVTSFGGDIHVNGTLGLGVEGDPGGNRVAAFQDGSVQEALFFSFAPETVNILQLALFERGGGGPSTFELSVDSVSAGLFTIGGGPDNVQETIDLTPLGLSGELLELRALSGNGFRVGSLRVGTIPEPHVLALVLVAMLAHRAARRRA